MTTTNWENVKWQELLKNSYRNVADLKKAVTFSEEEEKKLLKIEKEYPICVSPYYLSLINWDDENDPVRKMCIPQGSEFSLGGETDTSGEADNTKMQGMQHKYQQTALILSTNQCAMYCRHCFRKRLVGLQGNEIASQIPDLAHYVSEHKEIKNVLISGGDAFLNSNEVIKKYLDAFMPIEHVDYIRFGTRIPVVLPQRVFQDEELLDMLEAYGKQKQIIIVTQFNHPNEITPESIKAVNALQKRGCIVRNQAVLMKGINDQPNVLANLMNGLIKIGVIPYYVFQCRPVKGVKNQFQIPLNKAAKIVDEARKEMSGQAKSLHFVLSHETGKIEILGEDESGKMLFKYHQSKYPENDNKIFAKKLSENESWLEDM